MEHRYFFVSEAYGFSTFESLEEAKNYGINSLKSYQEDLGDDDITEDAEFAVIGEITHKAEVITTDKVSFNFAKIGDQKTGEFGGFETHAEQIAHLVKIIYELNEQANWLYVSFRILPINICLYASYLRKGLDFKADNYHGNEALKLMDFYHFIALAIDAEKQLKGWGKK